MNTDIGMVIDQIAREKEISRDVLIGALEEAILAAARRVFGTERDLIAEYNSEKGAVDLSQAIVVVETVDDSYNQISLEECDAREIDVEEGDEMVFPIFYLAQDAEAALEQDEEYGDILGLKTYRRSFGRIAAQTAKQVITHRLRDAERGHVYNEYKGRKGEMLTGVVRRFERGNLIIDLGRAEAILPLREQCSRESYRNGDRIQAFVLDVQEHARGPQIVLSRTAPELLVALFRLEVPEINESVVCIESAARDPGVRAKIAVSSSDRDVDPVGACVGMKGSRVQAVVQELRGEKIDIVPFSDEPATFVCNALQPAEVSRVLIDEGNHTMEIIVPDDQLSLAIGRRGQNVRLASQLTGWKLDIHSESRISEIKDQAWESLQRVEGLNEFFIQTLYNHGIRSSQALLDTDRDFLLQFPGIDEEGLAKMIESCKNVARAERQTAYEARRMADLMQKTAAYAKQLRELLGNSEEDRLRAVRGLGSTAIASLAKANITTVEALLEADAEMLVEQAELPERKIKQLQFGANKHLEFEQEVRDNAKQTGVWVDDEGIVHVPKDEDEEDAQEPLAASSATATTDGEDAEAAPTDVDAAIADSAAESSASQSELSE